LGLLTPLYEEHPDLMPSFLRPLEEAEMEKDVDPWPPAQPARSAVSEPPDDRATEENPSALMDRVGSDLQEALDLACRDVGELGAAAFRQGVQEVLVDVAKAKEYLLITGLDARAVAARRRTS